LFLFSFVVCHTMKSVAVLLLSIAAALSIAHAAECGDGVTCVLNEQTGVMVISGDGNMADYNKTSRPFWYSDREKIVEVVIEDRVLSIGNYSFADCINLKTVTFQDSVGFIGEYAFSNCSSLENLQLPNGITSILPHTFEYCSSISSVTIPASVESIDNFAFADCTDLTQVDLSNTAFIGEDAFGFCPNITSIVLPASLKKMVDGAFRGCTKLSSFAVAEGNQILKVEDGVLFNMDGSKLVAFPPGLENTTYSTPESVTALGEYAFARCNHLKEVNLTGKITLLPYRLFEYCDNLEHVYLPDSLEKMKQAIFQHCVNLKSIVIPNSVSGIGKHSFTNCRELREIVLPNHGNFTMIMDHTFDNCVSLKSLVIPGTVDTIRYHAFYGCAELTDVYYPGHPTEPVSHNNDVFVECNKLQHVCVDKEYKFDDFCGVPVSTTCDSSSSPASSHSNTSKAVLGSIPSLALLAALLFYLLF